MRKIFEVIVHKKTFDVFDIEGKEHPGYNGEPKTWWIYYADRLPEGTLPPVDAPSWEPWSSSLNRMLWNIRFTEYNSSKEKWGATQFRHGLHCEMECNGKVVYAFSTLNLEYAMAKAQYLITKMSEHPYNFFETEKENGRKIWWCGLPATIRPKSDTWEIVIIPDYTAGVDKPTWWKEFKARRSNLMEVKRDDDMDMWEEDDNFDYINWGDALSDGNIKWFRE